MKYERKKNPAELWIDEIEVMYKANKLVHIVVL
jgi:hypothetical protein